MADLIIRRGTIIDGTGAAPFVGDVEITGDRISAIGLDLVSDAAEVVDAEGLLVTPGFVDIHTHFDGQATWDPLLAPSSLHGVTSIAMGNCGVGFAPAALDRHDWLISLLEGVEDIPGSALAEGLSWGWETFPEYLDSLASSPHALDMGAHVPHAALRTYVMGERGANHLEVPTPEEIATMAKLVGEALDAGAIGFATSRTEIHRTSAGANIGTLAAGADELLAIAAVMADRGRGVVQLISDLYQTNDEDYFEAELDLLRRFVEVSGRPLSFTMQQAYHAPERWRAQMAWVDAMVAAGHDVKAQVATRPIGVLLGLTATANPFLFCASFDEVAKLPLSERVDALAEPARRGRILEEHAVIAAGLSPGIFQQIMTGFDVIFGLSDPVDYEMDREWSVAAQAGRAGVDPAGMVYDLMLSDGGNRLLYLPLFNFAHGNFDDIHSMITAPNILFGLSDAGAHCGAICDASVTTSSLVLWARDRRGGDKVPVERIVHANTQRNAAHVGWLDRGVVGVGYLADLNVIDFDALECHPPTIVYDLPAGGRRLTQTAEGYRFTIKSGAITFRDGEHTGALPGELLRGDLAAPVG